ncbi:MAG: S53 family peptidase [Chloroflexota bacterium]|nr:S53 family peptidase [Chloroflexota bacterium]
MKQPSRTLLAAAVLAVATPVVLLAPPAGRAPASVAPITAATPTPAHAPDLFQSLLASSQDRGPAPATRRVSLLLLLKDPAAAREQADLAAMYNPRSPRYGHYMTLAQYQATYGPSVASVNRVKGILKGAGLTVRWQKGDDWLTVAGPVRRIEGTFGASVHLYTAPNGVRYDASARDPRPPATLRPLIAGISHISSYVQPRLRARASRADASGLSPAGLLAAYDMTPLQQRFHFSGAGETVAFFEIDGYKQADLDAYTMRYHLPAIHPVIASGPRLSNVEGETEMDLEVVHAIAPYAKLVLYNFDIQAAGQAATSDADYSNSFLGPQTALINGSKGLVISQSWGRCDAIQGTAVAQAYSNAYFKGVALGETDFVASGDSGAYECLNTAKDGTPPSATYVTVGFPSALPYVTSVGGTRLSVDGRGNWSNETVWEGPAETVGSGGGLSYYFSRPSWQQGPGVLNQYSNGKRETPDVAADSDPATGVDTYTGGSRGNGGGTSQAAPIWAGMTVLINQYLKSNGLKPVGFVTPALYALAARSQAHPPFHDVTVGGNLAYPATPGYDMATGLGTPDAWNLAQDLATYERSGH